MSDECPCGSDHDGLTAGHVAEMLGKSTGSEIVGKILEASDPWGAFTRAVAAHDRIDSIRADRGGSRPLLEEMHDEELREAFDAYYGCAKEPEEPPEPPVVTV